MKLYKSLVLVIVFFLAILIFLYIHLPNWFNTLINTSLFTGVVTFLVGIVAMFLYFKQKDDFKSDTASIILMEIRQAEELIDELVNKSIGSSINSSIVLLLPTNNWNKYNYLFIKDLDQDELDLINRFYSKCSQIDKVMLQLNISTQLEQKANHIHQAITNLAKEISNIKDGNEKLTEKELLKEFNKRKATFLNIIENDGWRFTPKVAIEETSNALISLEKVINSSAGSKLKKIAKV
jgi:hypothetical protein